MKALLRGSLATLFGSVALFCASTALADGEACYVDTDCPGTACGDAVCNWSKSSPMPMGMKTFYCNPAGSQPKAADGWCNTDADCKCKGQGAKCVAPYCTFTKASDAPAGTGGSGAGGSASTAGATSAAGMTSTAGATSSAGTGSSTSPAPAASSNSGGCSVRGPSNTGSGIALALGALGLGVVFARRRR